MGEAGDFDRGGRGLLKVSERADGLWVDRCSSAVFQREAVTGGRERLRVGVPYGGGRMIRDLISTLTPPLQMLYVLHTPRGEGDPGRYQSPRLSCPELAGFLSRFAAFLEADARFDLWVRSASSDDLVVWDRHNDVYVYGALDSLAERLRGLGFKEGAPPTLGVHAHHYRSQFDGDAAEVLKSFAWTQTALHPEDEQLVDRAEERVDGTVPAASRNSPS